MLKTHVNIVSDGEPIHPIQRGLESNRGSEAAGIEKEDIVIEVVDADDNESIQRNSSLHDRTGAVKFIGQHGSCYFQRLSFDVLICIVVVVG